MQDCYTLITFGVCVSSLVLQEGIVDPGDASLRDFSALCVKEFLHWSIKQTSKQVNSKHAP